MNIIITIAVTALVVLYAGLFKAKKALLPLTLIGLLTALAFVVTSWNTEQVYYGMMQMDNFALAFLRDHHIGHPVHFPADSELFCEG